MSTSDSTTLASRALELYQSRRFEEAAAAYQELVRMQPGMAQAWYMLGTTSASLGRLDKALQAFDKALEIQPGHQDSLYGLAFVAYSQQKYSQAAECFRQVLAANPGNNQARNGLAATLQALGEYREALEQYDAAIKRAPVYVEAHFGRGCTLITLGETDEAIASLRETLRLAPNHIGAHISLASALMTYGKAEEALGFCEQAISIDPDNADAVALAATIEQHAGLAPQAMQRLQPWIDRGVSNINLAVAFAEVSKTLDQPEPAIQLLESLLAQYQRLPVTSQRNLHFNLGRLYDKTGQYEQAFENFRQGNIKRQLEFDPDLHRREIDAIIKIHSPAFMKTAPRATQHTDQPVFIVGMPRSGTSLIEQILDSLPGVHGAGELPDIWQMVARLPGLAGISLPYPGCLTQLDSARLDTLASQYLDHLQQLAPDAQRVIDKMPGNYHFLGLIARLFPGARIIHSRRDPIDTCLSCYFQDFSRSHGYSNDLGHLAEYYKGYQRLMDHWRSVLDVPILDIHYEDLIANQEATSRRMVEFIGVDWDDRCLNFHETRRFVATASYDQVRRPLYRKSVARWKHYAPFIGPLIKALQ